MGSKGSKEKPNSTEKEKIEDDVASNSSKQSNFSVKSKNKVEPSQKEIQFDQLSHSKFTILNLFNPQTRVIEKL